MAYDEKVAERVRKALAGRKGIAEKKMFGGVAFLVHGNMAVGVHGAELIVRLEPNDAAKALKEPGARIFDMTGRPMKGWLFVGAAGQRDEATFAAWVARAVAHAASLPKK